MVLGLSSALLPLPISLWFITFGFIAGYLSSFLLILGCAAGLRRRSLRILLATPVLWAMAMVLFASDTAKSYEKTRKRYFADIQAGKHLSLVEKASLYGLNIAMALAAFPVYPEAAMETLLLTVPTGQGTRDFRNGFFLESARIRESIAATPSEGKWKVAWPVAEYAAGGREARFALALNPCEIERSRDSGFIARVRIEYPGSSEVVLSEWPFRIAVEEGLFAYLQRKGWLFPYDAVWVSGPPD